MLGALEITLAVAVCIALVAVLAACVCGCRKDSHKVSGQNSQRSLPEIPPSVPCRQDSGDTASDLYATVQRVSEQSSPNTTRRSDHAYEHAYAKLRDGNHGTEETTVENETVVRNASATLPLLSNLSDESQSSTEGPVITASNAISGQVSSSRDLPYMTPPVVSIAPVINALEEPPVQQPNHFSGDSVDSAKGYTSISVREPLSSIRTNTTTAAISQPHYATVSDDSDEMYAAIEEPSNPVYTSGSETYAQIQPPPVQPVPIVATTTTVANTRSTNVQTNTTVFNATTTVPSTETVEVNPRRISAEAPAASTYQKHTRQASNSSCTGSVGTLGSPKPEKRQANSPLPPPPQPSTSDVLAVVPVPHRKSQESPVNHNKSSKHHKISSTGNLHDNDKLRRSLNEKHQRNNSCVSSSDFYGCNYPVDKHRFSSGDLVRPLVARELNFSFDKPAEKTGDAIYNTIDGTNDIYAAIDQEVPRKSLTVSQPNVTGSPIKNVEEMYAKVMKKTKLSSHSTPDHRSQPSSRLSNFDDAPLTREHASNSSRKKSSQNDEDKLSKPIDAKRLSGSSPTTSATLQDTKILNVQKLNKDDPGYETIDRIRNKSHGYETVTKTANPIKAEKVDPGYETVKESSKNQKHKVIPTVSGGLMQHSHNSVDILHRITLHDGRGASPINEPGYESVPSGPDSLISNDPGYEHIRRSERYTSDPDPNYEVLRSRNATPPYASIRNNKSQNNIPGYSVINKKPKVPDHNWSNNNENFGSEPNYESMPHENPYNTGSESDPNYESVGPKDPNYESVKFFDGAAKDPPYEKVKTSTNAGSDGPNFQRSGSSTSYEKVKSILKHDKHSDDKNDNRANGSTLSYPPENTPVADYFQV
ncbi:uncharacterized protein LOC143918824 isoform X2 [Arctopsyche grandis]|uniref:uncharacterized protein LOC143918824 isoform X2 n=1 Tax=Arctopsyche grandis TaxID=121162 RepID=UPI00406D9158